MQAQGTSPKGLVLLLYGKFLAWYFKLIFSRIIKKQCILLVRIVMSLL